MDYRDQNRAAYDRMVKQGAVFARVATDEECKSPLKTLDSRGWLPTSVHGLKVLCLAAGGGWQSILYATAGAQVTVVDISTEMLNLDRREAMRRRLSILAMEGSMDDLCMLADSYFDIVHHPVSTCYIADVQPVFQEVARVLKPDGMYISQHKQPTSLQVSERTPREQYVLGVEYYHQGPLPNVKDKSYREAGAVEYLHRWEDLLGGMCKAGLVIDAVSEPNRADVNSQPGQIGHRGRFIPPYIRIKARKLSRGGDEDEPASPLWVP